MTPLDDQRRAEAWDDQSNACFSITVATFSRQDGRQTATRKR